MKKLFHFFGSIHFAISLIATTTLFVIAGTLLESWADSHQFAASLTYEHPAFFVLLFFFFINILFAALRRWPFQIKHIPFLITHTGLLMIIAGVVVKTLFGLQGVMTLSEGSGSDFVFLPRTRALRLEDRDSHISYHALDDLSAPAQLIGYAPHSTESYDYWIKGNHGHIQGLPPFPVYYWSEGEIPLSGRAKFTEGKVWELAALRTKKVEEAMHQLSQRAAAQNSSPILAFLQDDSEDTHLYFFDDCGTVHHQTYQAHQLPALAVYDEGFGGYNAVAEIPYNPKTPSEIEELFLKELEKELQVADLSALSPPLQFLFQQTGDQAAATVCSLFRHWECPSRAAIPRLDWSVIDATLLRGLQWAATPLDKGDLLKEWPIEMPQEDPNEKEAAIVRQIVAIAADLPPIDFNRDAELLKAYFLSFGIYPAAIAPPPEALGVALEKITIETPLTFRQRAMTAEKKMEDNRPLATYRLEDGETVTLSYDSAGAGFCRPVCKGKYLARLQPAVQTIPYRVRLHSARQITYANSQQPFSYEAEVAINRKPAVLSMNHVHETWDGYRFYLSGISPHDESRVKRVQLIVNRDPAKYWLTYPGGILVTLGILLLFWWRRKK